MGAHGSDGIRPLLSRIAYGDEDTAELALDELGEAVCALGFVVTEATAPTVPLLFDLLAAPHVSRKAGLLDLLESICRAQQWHAAAAAAKRDRRGGNHREQTGWETAARAAVRAGRPLVGKLAASPRPEEAEPARRLLRAMDEVPPFPGI